MPRCGQAWAAGVHRGSQEAGGCKGTLGPTDAWFLSPHPHAWSDKHCVSISPGWQGTHFLGASCALRDFLPRHGLPASVAWHWGPLLAPAVCAQSTRGPDSCRPPLSPGSWSGRWPSEDPLASTCVCLKICTSLLVPTGLRRRRHCLEVSTCPSVWCCGLAGLGSGPGTVLGGLCSAKPRLWGSVAAPHWAPGGPVPRAGTVWGPPLSRLAPGPEG